MSREVPKDPTEHRLRVGEIELAFFEWGRAFKGREPTLLMVHATGFHARCWDPVIRHLGDCHVIAVDQRSHGRSEKTPIEHWDVFGRDLSAFVQGLDLPDVVGIGHSMGGHALVDAAATLPDRFRRLVIIDPVIASPDHYGEGGWRLSDLGGEPHPTAKRKRHFASPEEMIERFRDREPYRVFHPDALRAYCNYGLLLAEDGEGFELACPPEIEASIYMTSRTNAGVHESIRALEIPVLVLRAKLPPKERTMMDFSSSPTWPALVHQFHHGREIHFVERTHFLPMEIPEEIAKLILAGSGEGEEGEAAGSPDR
ncbi:MAG: alpha/beta hydrolase [bacterium]|nr:alpha/beta hydrolase [bacterium]